MIRPFFHFESFASLHLMHAVTTRTAPGTHWSTAPDSPMATLEVPGTAPSAGDPYSAFNLAFHVQDDEESVKHNRRELAAALGYPAEALHAAQQVHGTCARIVTPAKLASGPAPGALDWETAWPDTDALITGHGDVPLMILVADCAPILLADFDTWILAVVHAGWRGAVGRIASRTVSSMIQLGARPERIRAGIGPHLCPACFEIGDDVAAEAAAVAPASIVTGKAKPHLNLDAVLRADLVFAGVTQIETMPHCTRCENGTFFSHRGQGGTAGRFALVAKWNSR